jgi:hypothetical protein
MNISELVGNKLPEIKKVLFGSDDTTETVETTEEAAVEAAFLDAKLVDGTIVRVEPAVEVGAVVKVIDEAANEIDAPDGDHELEDGTIINGEEQMNGYIIEGGEDDVRATDAGGTIYVVDGMEDEVQIQYGDSSIYTIDGGENIN